MVNAVGTPAFFELPPPTLDNLNQVLAHIAASVLALLHRKGIWMEDTDGLTLEALRWTLTLADATNDL